METARIPTNLRTLLILETLADAGEPLTPTQINAQIGLPKQTIHRLCQTLLDEGFLIRDASGKKMGPAPRSVTMAKGVLTARDLQHARRTVLQHLSRKTGETVNYVLPDVSGMTYLDRVETDWAFRIELPIGSKVPFHCTASGKCYLASLEPRSQQRLLTSLPLDKRTPNTISDPAVLQRSLNTIQRQGYALDEEELFEGMVALAVPILSKHGQFQAAVAFHGPTQRLSPEKLMGHLDDVREAVRKLAHIETNQTEDG
ncbi:MAG: IclR family transcriptional regulator [Pseudomonadota bacterium]